MLDFPTWRKIWLWLIAGLCVFAALPSLQSRLSPTAGEHKAGPLGLEMAPDGAMDMARMNAAASTPLAKSTPPKLRPRLLSQTLRRSTKVAPSTTANTPPHALSTPASLPV